MRTFLILTAMALTSFVVESNTLDGLKYVSTDGSRKFDAFEDEQRTNAKRQPTDLQTAGTFYPVIGIAFPYYGYHRGYWHRPHWHHPQWHNPYLYHSYGWRPNYYGQWGGQGGQWGYGGGWRRQN